MPSELAPLVGQINHLLSHTEDSLRRSRNALGNLGHALKTPLAVLLSLASSERLKDLPDVRAQMREQLEQIQQRLARELNRARLAGMRCLARSSTATSSCRGCWGRWA